MGDNEQNQIERIVRLEEKVSQTSTLLEKFSTESKNDRAKLHQSVDAVMQELRAQRTFVGGIIFTITSLWSIILLAWDWLKAHV